MSLWGEALAHLAHVIASAPVTASIEAAVEEAVERELDAAAVQLMEKVGHLAGIFGMEAPALTAPVQPPT